MGHQRKLGAYGKNRIFGQKPRFRAQKKHTLHAGHHIKATTGKNCAKEKVPFSKINISLFSNFWVFFWEETDFWPKKQFSAERKSGHFSVILAETRSVVTVGHFLMAWTVQPSFVDDRVAESARSDEGASLIGKDLIDSGDPKQMLFCREIAFVAICVLFRDDISIF